MEQEYIEAVLVWSGTGERSLVRAWLSERNLQSTSMKAGLLVTGARADFESAFAMDLTHAEAPVEIPVPEELKGSVSTITIPPVRKIKK